jgi:hypothetical protein
MLRNLTQRPARMSRTIDKALGVIDGSNQGFPDSVEVSSAPITVVSDEEDVDNDYKYQRANFYNLVERGT